MTKDVLITIVGTQFDMGEEAIELKTLGTYYLKNGKHYLLFDEQPEDNGPITKNIVKMTEEHFEMTKKGGSNSFMQFRPGQQTSTIYCTPVGDIQMDVLTHDMSLIETAEEISANVKYALSINAQFVSECEVKVKVQARQEESA